MEVEEVSCYLRQRDIESRQQSARRRHKRHLKLPSESHLYAVNLCLDPDVL